MTDRTDALHLDDEALSAVLDGEGTPEESTHADGCAACGARLAELRDASLLVRAPVAPVDDPVRERAIAAALAAAAPSNVVPMRRRSVPRWLGAAAAAVVAVAAIGLVVRSGDDRQDTDDTAAGGRDEAAETSGATDETATALAAAPPPVDGGDLGAIEDRDLRAVIGSALARRARGGTTGAESGGSEEAPAVPPAAGGEGPASDSAAPGATGAGTVCEQAVREGNPGLGPLVYRATGTWEAEPAEVLAFELGGDRWVYVLDLDGCAIRNQQTHAG